MAWCRSTCPACWGCFQSVFPRPLADPDVRACGAPGSSLLLSGGSRTANERWVSRVVGADRAPNGGLVAVSRRDHRTPVLVALMLAMALVAMDSTIVATAIPQLVGDLGGFSLVGWVFSIFLLAQTVTIPVYGKLADLYGRKPVLVIGVVIFLIGSALSALSWNMVALIAFRGVQGLGAGAIGATVNTVAGDLYDLRERGKVQGGVARVWGISAGLAPALGGVGVALGAERPGLFRGCGGGCGRHRRGAEGGRAGHAAVAVDPPRDGRFVCSDPDRRVDGHRAVDVPAHLGPVSPGVGAGGGRVRARGNDHDVAGRLRLLRAALLANRLPRHGARGWAVHRDRRCRVQPDYCRVARVAAGGRQCHHGCGHGVYHLAAHRRAAVDRRLVSARGRHRWRDVLPVPRPEPRGGSLRGHHQCRPATPPQPGAGEPASQNPEPG